MHWAIVQVNANWYGALLAELVDFVVHCAAELRNDGSLRALPPQAVQQVHSKHDFANS